MASVEQQQQPSQQQEEEEEELPTAAALRLHRGGKRKSSEDDDDDDKKLPAVAPAYKKRATNLAASIKLLADVYNSDEEPPVKAASQEYLPWHLDDDDELEDSLCDWTIQIVTTAISTRPETAGAAAAEEAAAADNGHQAAAVEKVVVVKTYHVHRYALANGPHRSEYFARLFQHNFTESHNCTSRIELDELAAKAFPLLLDFLYAPPHMADTIIPFSTENATALYSLAKYFEIRRLQWLAKSFWKTDMCNSTTCGTYYEHGQILQQDAVLDAATLACAEHLLEIKPTGPTRDPKTVITGLSTMARRYLLDTQYWQRYLSIITSTSNNNNNNNADNNNDTNNGNKNNNNNTITKRHSYHLSLLLVEYFRETPDIVSLEQFHNFTNVTILPHIHVNAALPLLDLEREFMEIFATETAVAEADTADADAALPSEQEEEQEEVAAAAAASAELKLEERCIQVLAHQWDHIDWNNDEEPYKALLPKQNSLVVSKIFMACQTAAKATNDKLVTSNQAKQQQIHQLEQEKRERRNSSRYRSNAFGISVRAEREEIAVEAAMAQVRRAAQARAAAAQVRAAPARRAGGPLVPAAAHGRAAAGIAVLPVAAAAQGRAAEAAPPQLRAAVPPLFRARVAVLPAPAQVRAAAGGVAAPAAAPAGHAAAAADVALVAQQAWQVRAAASEARFRQRQRELAMQREALRQEAIREEIVIDIDESDDDIPPLRQVNIRLDENGVGDDADDFEDAFF